jgi:preprotein translocase subunit YajC
VATLIFIGIMLAIIWLLIIRPQRKRQMEHARLMAAVEVGDEIVTSGGLYGRVEAINDGELRVEIAPGTSVRLDKRAVTGVVNEQPGALQEAAGEGSKEPNPS